MTKKSYPIIGTKSALLWDESTDAWTYYSNEPERSGTPRGYYKTIPTLYRAVDIRASAIANLPWVLLRGEDEVDNSQDYQNVAGVFDNMATALYLIEASLVLSGRAYWKRDKNAAGYDKLRHLDPMSLELDEKRAIAGALVWRRQANDKEVELTADEVVYFWLPDPYAEIGPPSAWPTKAALAACGVLGNIDRFTASFFEKGAIKATLFTAEGMSLENAQDFENWWTRFVTGIRNAFTTKVLNASKMTPVVVGEGIKELENVTLTAEKREEIATAFAIPYTILFANAANYATAQQDKLNWYDDKVVPEAHWIASVLNEQVFGPLGYQFKFQPQTLDIYQADEEKRSASISAFMDAFLKFPNYEIGAGVLRSQGYEIDDEMDAAMRAYFEQKQANAEAMQERLSQPAQPDQNEPDDDEPDEAPPMRTADPQKLGRELSIWQSKVMKAVKRGEPASSVAFVPVEIPPENYERIAEALEYANGVEAVKAAFVDGMREGGEPVSDFVKDLAAWERAALAGKDYETVSVPPTLAASIVGSLEAATAEESVRAVFASARNWEGYP